MRRWFDESIEDVRFAGRTLARSPAFTAVAALTLALGIGVNTAIFMAVARALVQPLPYDDSGRLVVLYGASSRAPDARGMLSAAEIDAIHRRSQTTSGVAAFGLHGGYTYVSSDRTDLWQVTSVGPSFFRTLGAEALFGRSIDARDLEPDAPPVVLLSHDLWQRQFGADRSVIGRSVRLNGVSHSVIGVMPADFVAPWRTPEIWVPLDLDRFLSNPRMARARMLTAVARLRDERNDAGVRDELSFLARSTQANPGSEVSLAVNPVSARDAMVGEAGTILLLVMGAALLLLALACVNLAALSLTRWTARRHELSVRSALGARPWRLVRQTLAEGMVIGIVGGALGVAVATWTHSILLLPTGDTLLPPMGTPARMSPVVLTFAAFLSIGSGVAFGLLPALLAARTAPGARPDEGGRGAAGGRRTTWLGRALVAGQVALAVLLLVGAGLLGRTLHAIQSQGVGYRTDDHVLTFRVTLSGDRYADPGRPPQFFREFLQQIRALPGVEAAGIISISPWNGWYSTFARAAGADDSVRVVLAPVSEGFFAALEIPVLNGRGIAAEDRPGAGGVAVVSERMATQLWPAGSPIGARLSLGGDENEEVTVVGVAGDVREAPTSEPPPVAYVSAWHQPERSYELVVGANGPATPLIPGIRNALRDIDPAVPLAFPRTMAEVYAGQLAPARVPMSFLGGFAVLALVLAGMGIYGVVGYSVAARGREIGIRMGLGGRRAGILLLVLGQGLRTAAVGAAAGLVLAAFASRVLGSMLYAVSTHDLATFVAAPLILLLASAVASLIPAYRATRIDPVEAMRAG